MATKCYEGLSRDIARLYIEEISCDVIIQAGEEPHVKEFNAHSLILQARSPYFRVALSANWARKEANKIMYKKPTFCLKYWKLS